jgi:hypothetical protein
VVERFENKKRHKGSIHVETANQNNADPKCILVFFIYDGLSHNDVEWLNQENDELNTV